MELKQQSRKESDFLREGTFTTVKANDEISEYRQRLLISQLVFVSSYCKNFVSLEYQS